MKQPDIPVGDDSWVYLGLLNQVSLWLVMKQVTIGHRWIVSIQPCGHNQVHLGLLHHQPGVSLWLVMKQVGAAASRTTRTVGG